MTDWQSRHEDLNSFINIETISIKNPYYVDPPSVEKIIEILRKKIEESLELVKLIQELGCGEYSTEDRLSEVLNDVENLKTQIRPESKYLSNS